MQPGKLRSLDRLADRHGRFEILAIDQRPPIFRLVEERGASDVPAATALVKRTVIDGLAHTATATLVDPETAMGIYGDLDPHRGLMLTLEHHVFDDGPGGRRSSTIPGWSVERLKRAGADGVKVLAWHRPDASADVLGHQDDFVRSIGAECREHDIPFVLEMLTYPLLDGDGSTSPADRALHVRATAAHFADPEFGVDLFKLESPLDPDALPDPDDDDGSVQAVFDELDAMVERPWVLLSGGADRPAFVNAVRYACSAGASGFLAGRSIWYPAVSNFPDRARMADELRTDAAAFMATLHDVVDACAPSWRTQMRRLGPPVIDGYERADTLAGSGVS